MITQLGVLAVRHWIGVALVVAVLKIALGAWMPLTGDEAYFASWGLVPDFGYYDHPPMAGWMMAAMQSIGDHRLILRLPGMATSFALAGIFWWLLRGIHKERAALVALVILVSPLNLINVFTLTDTGVILFSGLSLAAVIAGLRENHYGFAILSGVFLGLAFLSKYFAALLVLAYGLYFFLIDKHLWRYGVVVLLASLPFALLNFYWNYTHCWANFAFNFFNRHDAVSGIDLTSLVLYLLTTLYVFLPPVLLAFLRLKKDAATGHQAFPLVCRPAVSVLVFGLLCFAAISVWREVGLHWLLWLHIFAIVALFPLEPLRWQRLAGWLIVWSLVHVMVVPVVLYALIGPVGFNHELRRDWVTLSNVEEIFHKAQSVVNSHPDVSLTTEDLLIATGSYSSAAIAQYRSGKKVYVFGAGSRYGRQQDFWVDFSKLDQTDWLIFTKDAPNVDRFTPFFANVVPLAVDIKEQTFHFVLAAGLNAPVYIERVIAPAIERYYDLPSWLPKGECSARIRHE